MLLEREIKTFIRNTLLSPILKQLAPGNTVPSSLPIKLDLTKTLRHNYAVGVFVIGDYPQFYKLLEDCLAEGVLEAKAVPPVEGICIELMLTNCPLPRHNIQSVEFLSAAFEQQKGVLVYLKDARITRAHQSETYLSAWVESWTRQCHCSEEQEKKRRKQSLLEIVKAKTQNIRQAVTTDQLRCEHCSAKMAMQKMQGRHFRNCQRVTVTLTARDGSKEELFQRAQVDILLDQSQVDKFAEGDVIDLCCYYSTEPKITKILPNGSIFLRADCGLLLVSSYPSSPLSSNNNHFFSNLQGISCEYIRCMDPRDEDTVCYNYKNLLKTINCIRFPYLGENTLSTVKLIALNSLFSLAHRVPLHFLAVTDEVALLRQALQIQGVAIRTWPSLYDLQTLAHFLATCHNCVLIASNPSRKDFQHLHALLTGKMALGVTFALWVVTEPIPELRKQPALEKFQVVIDLSLQKNFNICRAVYDSMIDQKLQSFIEDTHEISMTAPRGRRRAPETDFGGENFEGVQSDEREMESEYRTALQLLQRYFVRAREYKTINPASLQNIRNIAQGFAYFRHFLRSSSSPPSKPPSSSPPSKPQINVLDAMLSIFIQEQTSRSKFSPSNTLFSNEISKLMLNEGDCELSFWEYEADEELGLGESKKYIPKDEMFKRMVNKMIALLYSHEIS